mgnify:CR=1 FL=1
MVVVVDANILISAALTPLGPIADFIFSNSSKTQFIAPAFILDETKANEARICAKSKISISEFKQNLLLLLSRLIIVEDDEISDEIFKKAFELTKTIDTKDTIYIALAISFAQIGRIAFLPFQSLVCMRKVGGALLVLHRHQTKFYQ